MWKCVKLIGFFCGYRFIIMAVALSYLLIIIMRWIAGPVILICIILFVGFFVFGKYHVLCGVLYYFIIGLYFYFTLFYVVKRFVESWNMSAQKAWYVGVMTALCLPRYNKYCQSQFDLLWIYYYHTCFTIELTSVRDDAFYLYQFDDDLLRSLIDGICSVYT